MLSNGKAANARAPMGLGRRGTAVERLRLQVGSGAQRTEILPEGLPVVPLPDAYGGSPAILNEYYFFYFKFI